MDSSISPPPKKKYKFLQLLEEKYQVSSFINNDFNKVAKIHQGQRIESFFEVDINVEHCFEVSKAIHDYLQSISYRSNIPYNQYSLSPVIGLFHHYYQNDNDDLSNKNIRNKDFQMIMKAYKYVFTDLLIKYRKSKERQWKVGEIRLTEPQKEDYAFSKLFQEQISSLLGDQEILINNFLCVLFFDFYVALKYFKKNNIKNDNIKTISLFALNIFPLIMGVYKFGNHSSGLRDNAFFLYAPPNFNKVQRLIDSSIKNNKFLGDIKKHVLKIVKNFPARVLIQARKKSAFSAYLKSHSYRCSINELWDLEAMRIIIDSDDIQLCYQMSAQIQNKFSRWKNEKGYFNYIANPKKNGYQSVHLVLESKEAQLIEVQIRTKTMHLLAELGSASHQNYKVASVGIEYSAEVLRGKKILEKYLEKNNLSIDDYITHLKHALSYLPMEHYYKGIARNKYQPEAIIQAILTSKRNNHER